MLDASEEDKEDAAEFEKIVQDKYSAEISHCVNTGLIDTDQGELRSWLIMVISLQFFQWYSGQNMTKWLLSPHQLFLLRSSKGMS